MRKPKDPNDPFGVMSGGAINSAVDNISFAHDIVMCSATPAATVTITSATTATTPTTTIQGITGGKPSKIPKAQAVGTKNSIHPGPENGALNSMLTHLHDPNAPGALPISAAHYPDAQKNYKDPLRELVLISEAICVNDKDTAYLTNVKSLAKEAAVLENVIEVMPEQAGLMPLSPAPLGGQAAITAEMPSTLNLFQDPKDMVDPTKEREFMKRLEALDEADSEGFDGNS